MRRSLSAARVAELVWAAKRAREKAYCPYSLYPVGAAVLGESGRIYAGANVENASFGLSMCAERTAIFRAVSTGEKKLKAVCVASRLGSPCGACRQVMIEFSTVDTQLILVNVQDGGKPDALRRMSVFSMLPRPFDPVKSGLLG